MSAIALSLVTASTAGAASVNWPPDSSWTLNGQAAISSGNLVLTQQGVTNQISAAWFNAPVASQGLNVSFTVNMGTPWGADGITLALADPTQNTTHTIGSLGGGLGFTAGGGNPGVKGGVGVALDTYQNVNDPSKNFVGFLSGGTGTTKTWIATSPLTTSLYGTHTVNVSYSGGVLTLTLDGTQVLSSAVTLTPTVLLGFTGATGGLTDDHIITQFSATTSDVSLSSGGFNGGFIVVLLGAGALGVFSLTHRRRTHRSTRL